MRSFLKNLWNSRINVLYTWVFFLCLTLVGKTPYSILELILISGGVSIGIITLTILFFKINSHKK